MQINYLTMFKIFTINNKKEAKFLRKKTADFDPLLLRDAKRRGEIIELVKKMREIMIATNGIGLSANQLGLNLKVFVVQISKTQNVADNKQYAIFNPEIIKFSKEKITMEEGCLSVPGVYGLVERPEKITLIGRDKYGKKVKIKAWGLLARVFQHEVDHLNGILFIDRTKNIIKKIEASK